jgi:hypothetical protein
MWPAYQDCAHPPHANNNDNHMQPTSSQAAVSTGVVGLTMVMSRMLAMGLHCANSSSTIWWLWCTSTSSRRHTPPAGGGPAAAAATEEEERAEAAATGGCTAFSLGTPPADRAAAGPAPGSAHAST